jgi:hypothetical protein
MIATASSEQVGEAVQAFGLKVLRTPRRYEKPVFKHISRLRIYLELHGWVGKPHLIIVHETGCGFVGLERYFY